MRARAPCGTSARWLPGSAGGRCVRPRSKQRFILALQVRENIHSSTHFGAGACAASRGKEHVVRVTGGRGFENLNRPFTLVRAAVQRPALPQGKRGFSPHSNCFSTVAGGVNIRACMPGPSDGAAWAWVSWGERPVSPGLVEPARSTQPGPSAHLQRASAVSLNGGGTHGVHMGEPR